MPKTLTLRLDEHDAQIVTELKETYASATATKAILTVLRLHKVLLLELHRNAELHAETSRQLEVARQTIDDAHAAASALIEKTGQKDLLD
jgi:hypothetical protein